MPSTLAHALTGAPGVQVDGIGVYMPRPVLPADAQALVCWSKPDLYAARAWFLANQKMVGTMFAFNALNAIEQALAAK